MNQKLINAQLSNKVTCDMYIRQFLNLAENVFSFKNINNYIDTAYMNKHLISDGGIAFFKDELISEDPLCLPYAVIGRLDVYGRPQKIRVMSQNGYSRTLDKDEFVIMYDNNGRYPLYLDILQYAIRYAQATRVIDINIDQQKTPRFWKTKTDKERSLKDIINNVDGYSNIVVTYNDIDLDDTTLVLQPSPFVADKVSIEKDKIYNEFLRLIGVANLAYQKKERNITDEINAMQGGTIASRFTRFEPRKKAIEEINKKWGTNIEVEYYDGIPTTSEELETNIEETEVEE